MAMVEEELDVKIEIEIGKDKIIKDMFQEIRAIKPITIHIETMSFDISP